MKRALFFFSLSVNRQVHNEAQYTSIVSKLCADHDQTYIKAKSQSDILPVKVKINQILSNLHIYLPAVQYNHYLHDALLISRQDWEKRASCGLLGYFCEPLYCPMARASNPIAPNPIFSLVFMTHQLTFCRARKYLSSIVYCWLFVKSWSGIGAIPHSIPTSPNLTLSIRKTPQTVFWQDLEVCTSRRLLYCYPFVKCRSG